MSRIVRCRRTDTGSFALLPGERVEQSDPITRKLVVTTIIN